MIQMTLLHIKNFLFDDKTVVSPELNNSLMTKQTHHHYMLSHILNKEESSDILSLGF